MEKIIFVSGSITLSMTDTGMYFVQGRVFSKLLDAWNAFTAYEGCDPYDHVPQYVLDRIHSF